MEIRRDASFRHFMVVQEQDVARVLQDRGNIRGEEVLAGAKPDHQRRTVADSDHLVGLIDGDDGASVDPAHGLERAAHGRLQVALVVLLDQMRQDLRVGFGKELVLFLQQRVAQLQVVFDDAVVNDHDAVLAVMVRMRVFFGRTPVRGPARVPDAEQPAQRLRANDFFQVAQLSRRAADLQPAVPNHGNAGRVVTAVLQPLEAVNQDRNDFLLPDVTDNPTHRFLTAKNAKVEGPHVSE